MKALIIFIFGLAIGSFLNVVILRIGKKKSFFKGRSLCSHCLKTLAWFDNIPLLSFVSLAGRCRYCRKRISWQYPLVELASALIFVWLYQRFGLTFQFFAYAILSCFLLVIFIYDLKHYLILDRVVLPAMVIAFFANLYLGFGFWNLALGAVLGSGFFALQFFVSKGKWVGGGDIRLGALMGLMLGWKFLLVALFIAYFIGAVFGIILMALKQKKMSSAIPFGPFLTGATFIALLYGQDLLNWYLGLLY